MTEQSREIFLDALEKEKSERESFIREQCADDDLLRRRVEKLLRAHEKSDSIFGRADVPMLPTEGSPGKQVGAFELQEVIGEGGFAVVWRASQKAPVIRDVALKILKRGMETAESVARFESERQALALMDHPSIAKVLDGGSTENRLPWFAMELVDGQAVTDFCNDRGLARNQRLSLFQEICRAVQHAHQRGVLHRDLKPSNILVRDGQEGPQVKVIDFGIAKMIDEAAALSSVHTMEGHWVGTPGYMSPEQLDENPDLDTRSDVYALGVLLYELLCGTRPIDDDTLRAASTAEVIRLIREVDPPKPSTRAGTRELRGDLDWITMRCLEKSRERRYDSVSALALDIQNHLDGAPVLAGPPHLRYRLAKFTRRYRIPLAVAGLAFALLVGGIVSSLVQLKRARAAEVELQAQVAQTETELAKFLAISDFYESVLMSVDPGFAQGMDTELLERVLTSASLRIERESEGNAEVEATIRRVVGGAYRSLGHYEESEAELTRALELRREHLGPLHIDTLTSALEYGSTLQMRGQLAAALPLLREAYLGFAQILGPEHEKTLNARTNLAVTLKESRKLEEALEHLRAVEKAYISLHGEAHEDSIRAMNNLASTLAETGNLSEATERYERGARLQGKVQGRNHPETLMAFNNLAHMYSEGGRHANALAILEEVHEIKLEILPAGHPSLLASFNNLAMTAKEAGNRDRAITLLQEGIEMASQANTRNVPNALLLQTNYCRFLSGDGKLDEARELYADTVARARAHLGEANPMTLTMMGLYASFLAEKFGPDEAESLADETLVLARQILSADDLQFPIHLLRYTEILMLQERYEEAEPLLLELIEIAERNELTNTLEKAQAFLQDIEDA